MIIIAPDSFKGTLSAVEVCEIIRNEIIKAKSDVDVKCIPVADGGEGTVDAMLFNGGKRVTVTVFNPYFEQIKAEYGILPGGTAIIEMAAASGLPLVGERKNPLITTTYGTGQIILDAVDRGCKKILIGIGGSATNDGGMGCCAALGVRFYNREGESVPLNGSGLSDVADIDLSGLDERIKSVQLEVLCDVVSPLYGENGAAYVFAPQKGADEKGVKLLDDGLRNLADVVKCKLDIDNAGLEGSGAAGGLGYGLVTFLKAKPVKGAPTLLKILNFDELAKGAELVITGEGCMDEQSLLGKAPAQVAELSGDTPVVAVVGMSKVKSLDNSKILKIYPTISEPLPFEEIKKNCEANLKQAMQTVINEWILK